MATLYYDHMTSLFTEYLIQLRRRLPVLILISLAMAVCAYAVVNRQGITHEVHFSYLVSLQERSPSSQYQFDGYYALQAIELFTETLSKWVITPEVLVEAYQRAQVPLPGLSQRQLQAGVSAEQAAPQLVHVVIRNQNVEYAKKVAAALDTTIQEKVTLYQEQGTPAVQFKIVATKPWAGKSSLNNVLILVATALGTFFIGLNLVLLWEGLKRV